MKTYIEDTTQNPMQDSSKTAAERAVALSKELDFKWGENGDAPLEPMAVEPPERAEQGKVAPCIKKRK